MTLKSQWILLTLFAALPYLVLGAAGAWWLFDTGWWLWWVGWTAIVSLVGWPLMRWLQKRTSLPLPTSAGAAHDWPPAGRAAWTQVEAIAVRMQNEDLSFDRPEPAMKLAKDVVETVARQFHPRSKQPLFEIPVPHLLRIVELVTHDLRETLSANIPGSHILTINDLLRLKKIAQIAPTLYRLYRIAALVINPATALARELNVLAQDKMLTSSTNETKRWLLQFVVRKTGFYAIELYSGNLELRGVEFAPYSTASSRRAIADDHNRTTSVAEEPLRILVIGQVKAGKSSLVNALFGEVRAAVDVVPTTKSIEPYLLERDGMQRAIVLDTAGYEDASQTAAALEQARDEVFRCELVILVSSAQSAARDADRRMLDEVRTLYQRNPDREFPPLVVALTHIDQLRPFREWDPPYDLSQPQVPKAQQIREAVEATAGDLQIELEQVIPVCLQAGKLYNVEEGLIPAIFAMLGSAQRLKYLRCLREFKDEEYWRLLRQQAVNAGRILLKTGKHLLESAGQALQKPESRH